jgi:hypothetical protein
MMYISVKAFPPLILKRFRLRQAQRTVPPKGGLPPRGGTGGVTLDFANRSGVYRFNQVSKSVGLRGECVGKKSLCLRALLCCCGLVVYGSSSRATGLCGRSVGSGFCALVAPCAAGRPTVQMRKVI